MATELTYRVDGMSCAHCRVAAVHDGVDGIVPA